jgi:RHS repeat-associated protein
MRVDPSSSPDLGLNINEPLAMLRSGATSYYHADGLGSVTSLSGAAGSIANTYTYDSFGRLITSTGSLVNPFQYTAREFDTETNLYDYRARYDDQNSSRFLSEDPIGLNGALNFYAYVDNDPQDYDDPFGLEKYKCPLFGPCTHLPSGGRRLPPVPNSAGSSLVDQ